MKRSKRILAGLLVLLLVMASVPVVASAATPTDYQARGVVTVVPGTGDAAGNNAVYRLAISFSSVNGFQVAGFALNFDNTVITPVTAAAPHTDVTLAHGPVAGNAAPISVPDLTAVAVTSATIGTRTAIGTAPMNIMGNVGTDGALFPVAVFYFRATSLNALVAPGVLRFENAADSGSLIGIGPTGIAGGGGVEIGGSIPGGMARWGATVDPAVAPNIIIANSQVSIDFPPVRNISIAPTGAHNFGTEFFGYAAAPAAHTVTVTNTGNTDIAQVNVTLGGSGASAFTLASTPITNLLQGTAAAQTFTVQPNTGLAVGTYTATVTVTAPAAPRPAPLTGNFPAVTHTFQVTFQVEAAPARGISLTPPTITESTNLGYLNTDYTTTITVANTGAEDTGALTIALSGPDAASFTLSTASITDILVGDDDTFTVTPVAGLMGGVYTATITVSGTDMTDQTVPISFTVFDLPTQDPGDTADPTDFAADLARLIAAYNDAITRAQADGPYTAESWADLVTARDAAEAILTGGGTITQAEVDDAATTLEDAIANLEVIGACDCPVACDCEYEECECCDLPVIPGDDFPFDDVPEDDWYWARDAVEFVYDNDIMDGTGYREFSPGMILTRAQVARILWNMEGQPAVAFRDEFSDVADGQWYSTAIIWALDEGVMIGYGDGRFGPADNITREQFATTLRRYADEAGPADFELDFPDANQVSYWAQEGVEWAVDEGLILGTGGGLLNPRGNAMRAEGAIILMRFMER